MSETRFPLGSLTLEAVLPLAMAESRVPSDVVADRMKISLSALHRSFNPADRYFVTFGDVPRLCWVMRTDILLRWARERYGYLCAHSGLDLAGPRPADALGALRGMALVMREVGEAADAAQEAARDGELDADECRRLLRELADVGAAVQESMGRLEALRATLEERR